MRRTVDHNGWQYRAEREAVSTQENIQGNNTLYKVQDSRQEDKQIEESRKKKRRQADDRCICIN